MHLPGASVEISDSFSPLRFSFRFTMNLLGWFSFRTELERFYKVHHVLNFPAPHVALFCFVLAVLVHPDLNNRPIFDAIWTSSLYVDVVSLLPQLWLMGKQGDNKSVDAFSAHYIFLIAIIE